MKKALVLALVCAFGLGAAAFAGPLSGKWVSSFEINPTATELSLLFTSFSSVLSIDYTIGGWTFGSDTKFSLLGWVDQSFDATGMLGAFTFTTTMDFSPSVVTVYTWPAGFTSLTPAQTAQLPQTYCTTAWKGTPSTFAPQMLTWQAEGDVKIAGMEFGGLLFMDQSQNVVTHIGNLFHLTGGTTYVQSDSCVPADCANGVGWRFLASGLFGNTTLSSYTYFNLTEYTASEAYAYGFSLTPVLCPIDLAKAGYFCIPNPGCAVVFTEEYVLLQGFEFGCATIDAALKIECDGFDSIFFAAKDIELGGWLDLDIGIKFTTTSKDVYLCGSLIPFLIDCFTIEAGFGNTLVMTGTNGPLTIGDITIHGFAFSYTFDGVTFKAYTELDKYSKLFSTATDWMYLNGLTKIGYLVPSLAYYDCVAECVDGCTPGDMHQYDLSDNVFAVSCIPTTRIRLWEKWSLTYSGDSCCGGAVSAAINVFFGEAEKLGWYGYATADQGDSAYHSPVVLFTDGTTAAYSWSGLTPSTSLWDAVSVKSVYIVDTAVKSLFDWAMMDVTVSIGLGSNFKIDLGLANSLYGFQKIKFGFTFTW